MRKISESEYGETLLKIQKMDSLCDELISELDSWWFSAENLNKPNRDFYAYENEKNKILGPILTELKSLKRLERFNRRPELSDIPKYGDRMSLYEFISNVKSGGFIDYDGWGKYIDSDKMTNIEIYPSDIHNGMIRMEFNEIVWFNR